MPSLRIFTVPLLLVLIAPGICHAIDEDLYSECMLENLKSGMSDLTVRSVRGACAHRATPKKCRGLKPARLNAFGDQEIGSKEYCEDECKKAGYLSRKFGECSAG